MLECPKKALMLFLVLAARFREDLKEFKMEYFENFVPNQGKNSN